jgi:hypothetical protein
VIRPRGSKKHEIVIKINDDDTICLDYDAWYDLSEPMPGSTQDISVRELLKLLDNQEMLNSLKTDKNGPERATNGCD